MFGVLSWKKGTRRARWVARESELGARGRGSEPGARRPDGYADQSWACGAGRLGGTRIGAGGRGRLGGTQIGGSRTPERGSQLVSGNAESARRVPAPTQRAPGPDTESAWLDTDSERAAGPYTDI